MPIRVCVFDDHKKVREALGVILKGHSDFEFAGAFEDCNNVIRDVVSAQPDVILMDIEMPGVSGIEAVKIVHKEFPAIKIIMQTVFADDDKIFYSICFGASGYLLKSTPPGKILEALKEVNEGGAPMTPQIASKVLHLFQQNLPGQQMMVKEDYQLSKREKEVLELLVQGKSLKMLAGELTISYDTVRSHIKNIYEKLHVASMTEAVAKAINERLV
ncbi:MAG: response regulator transcription factor [Fimbriimonadaceae bacterium]|nr:response regulator transcription factor [Chitinophagales bacterium]